MNYTSTRNSRKKVTAAEAIIKGISDDGGLFVPSDLGALPKLTEDVLGDIAAKSYNAYQEVAFDVLQPILGFSEKDNEELRECVNNAYGAENLGENCGAGKFRTVGTTRLVKLDDNKSRGPAYVLELWHGPTAAFKDMALQILPGLITLAKKNVKGTAPRTVILTATSGDTGKAALEGFKNVAGIDIAVFYPVNGVSDMQKLQMTTQEGNNVHVFAVNGNFDDCQSAVKDVFGDANVSAKAQNAGIMFSSANSINWGRLCPQIVYYVSAYADLVRNKAIRCGEKINICVPTGNFGNILAAYYAVAMGLPVNKLICASNANNVLTDFIETGVYDINREFKTTVSPSMDILVSSNLERLLYHLSGNDDKVINEWFTSLKNDGKFEVGKDVLAKLKALLYGGWCNEDDTTDTIKKVYETYGYLMDTHTAVGYKVWTDYAVTMGDFNTKTIIVSTANPYKFSETVHEALFGKYVSAHDDRDIMPVDIESDEYDGDAQSITLHDLGVVNALEERTEIRAPKSLTDVETKAIRFTEVLEKSQIKDIVLKIF
ncbi:MAG: threonine synthase [Oscillospiraceae bacterium]|nr:threonine synthase [Oscillospiraceae bacterium]